VGDIELLTAWRGGRTQAFDSLHDRYRDVLHLHARAICRDDALAEDAVNETFLRLARSGDAGMAESGSLAPFLHRTLRRIVLDRLRSETASKRRERAAAERWVRSDRTPPEDVERLNAALPRLAPEQLEIIILHVYGGLTFQQAADTVGIPLQTAISRYRYALQHLAKRLGEPS
jgi:RNA polymerase sigma-70 factor, ECF subfamily